ncbi:MAG: hypothetical protein ACOVQ2_07445 [Flavobacterium sp.]
MIKKKIFTYILVFGLIFIQFSCNLETEIQPQKLNGYWEISKVTKENGEEVDYGFNTTIDFFEINNNKGIRKKIYPKFEGKYQADILADSIFITQKEGVFILEIKNNQWKTSEEISILNDSVFGYTSKNGMEYLYKRHKKIEL